MLKKHPDRRRPCILPRATTHFAGAWQLWWRGVARWMRLMFGKQERGHGWAWTLERAGVQQRHGVQAKKLSCRAGELCNWTQRTSLCG